MSRRPLRKGSVNWALACVIVEMRTGQRLESPTLERRLVDQKAITKVTRVNSRLTQENARRRIEM
jgi:hypothetical protein